MSSPRPFVCNHYLFNNPTPTLPSHCSNRLRNLALPAIRQWLWLQWSQRMPLNIEEIGSTVPKLVLGVHALLTYTPVLGCMTRLFTTSACLRRVELTVIELTSIKRKDGEQPKPITTNKSGTSSRKAARMASNVSARRPTSAFAPGYPQLLRGFWRKNSQSGCVQARKTRCGIY